MATNIPPHNLAEVIDACVCVLDDPEVTLAEDVYKRQVSIRAGYASFTISAESAEDYPELPDVGDGREIYIPQNKLKELISGTIFAVSENQGRPIHTLSLIHI